MTKGFLRSQIRKLEAEIMNGRQAAKLAAKHIEELENYNRRATADIKAYNQIVLGMIEGKSPCDWCEENEDCERPIKGKGCSEWWLTYGVVKNDEEETGKDDSEGVHVEGSTGRA